MLSGYHDYAGVIHVHSTYSDGLKDVRKIVKAANRAGCDFMILTDHNTLKALPEEGWHKKTALLVGEEISVGKRGGHYLAMRLSSEVTPRQSHQETIDEVSAKGGVGFIAHPFSNDGRSIFRLTVTPWQEWSAEGFNGLEVWNYSHDWIENLFGPFFIPIGLIRPDLFIDGPPEETLKKWDELQSRSKVYGIGSVDAHGYFYSYKRMFKTLRTHVLLKEPLSFQLASFEKDKHSIYQALENGNCYLSYDYLSGGSGFIFTAQNGWSGAIMGDELCLGPETYMKVSAPRAGLLRIIKNGRVVASAGNTRSLIKKVQEPGAYRAEVFLDTFVGLRRRRQPWIFSNPIYVIRG